MVIGGYVGRRSDDVEELRMNSSVQNDCPVAERFPVTIDGAVGANMGGTPIVCAGEQNGPDSNQCWTYNLTSRMWTNSGQ